MPLPFFKQISYGGTLTSKARRPTLLSLSLNTSWGQRRLKEHHHLLYPRNRGSESREPVTSGRKVTGRSDNDVWSVIVHLCSFSEQIRHFTYLVNFCNLFWELRLRYCVDILHSTTINILHHTEKHYSELQRVLMFSERPQVPILNFQRIFMKEEWIWTLRSTWNTRTIFRVHFYALGTMPKTLFFPTLNHLTCPKTLFSHPSTWIQFRDEKMETK